jgi:predicted NBD/HSP70 family sugar kinase
MPKISRPKSRLLRLLRLIYDQEQVSRSELTRQTGYSTFLLSRMCDELLRAGLVCETGPGNSTGGRPPTLLSINPELGRLVGVHVGTVNVRVAVTDMSGELLAYRKAESRAAEGPETALPHLMSLVEGSLGEAGVGTGKLRGIGIGISGVLDRETGTTRFWPKLPQWVDVPVKQAFAERFGTLVEVEDSPRTMALAERRYGGGSRVDDLIYVAVGAGTGAALFLHGELYTGAGGFAGEFGHITVEENGPLCSCGNRGCVEALVSASALIRQARASVTQGLAVQLWQLCQGDPARISVELIVQAAAASDRFCLNLLRQAGAYLGIGVAGLVNLFNPQRIIIGGGLALAAGSYLLPAVEEVVRHRALAQPAAQVSILLSRLDETDWARGAALLLTRRALEQAFEESRRLVEVAD